MASAPTAGAPAWRPAGARDVARLGAAALVLVGLEILLFGARARLVSTRARLAAVERAVAAARADVRRATAAVAAAGGQDAAHAALARARGRHERLRRLAAARSQVLDALRAAVAGATGGAAADAFVAGRAPVSLSSLVVSRGSLRLEALAAGREHASEALGRLGGSPRFERVELASVASGPEGVRFRVVARLAAAAEPP